MALLSQRTAQFGNVRFHVKSVSLGYGNGAGYSYRDSKNSKVISVGGNIDKNVTVNAFLQGKHAKQDKDALLAYVENFVKKNEDESEIYQRVLFLPNMVNSHALLNKVNVNYQHQNGDFYELTLNFELAVERPDKDRKSIKGLGFLDKLQEANETLDKSTQEFHEKFVQAPSHKINHVGKVLNHSLQHLENFKGFLENPLQNDLGVALGNIDQLIGRFRRLAQPARDSNISGMAVVLAAANFGGETSERASSEEEARSVADLQTFAIGYFVVESCKVLIENPPHSDQKSKEELRVAFNQAIARLQAGFTRDIERHREQIKIFFELEALLNQYFLENNGAIRYRSYRAHQTMPLISLLWQIYGNQWVHAKRLVLQINNFTQAGVVAKEQILLMPENLDDEGAQ